MRLHSFDLHSFGGSPSYFTGIVLGILFRLYGLTAKTHTNQFDRRNEYLPQVIVLYENS